ncbi:uncharacterized protein PHALS_14936 [Plasmopara halstedii]|uniref:Uncharacterized protein n=1 Tax=Plasmopara halstedii TaxID=4781 RepID=A0A0N7L7E3_PLAHL|nr:uncharacterized protein PHALS_14936 [Plasmopara halstedii]CEG46835.1 hypothetical protein PHALS_14936 [Plasmopara halstedii]|eukprot:XP_024583204.1 hypothetical protein PHALS_14936 [Plasmopara halstedii]
MSQRKAFQRTTVDIEVVIDLLSTNVVLRLLLSTLACPVYVMTNHIFSNKTSISGRKLLNLEDLCFLKCLACFITPLIA